jgi:uncharacterized repeat protein (TIGR02543 family)
MVAVHHEGGDMRKVLSVLVVVCLVLSLLTGVFAPVPAARADTYGDYTYTVSGGNATITGYTGLGGVVVLPSMLGGYPVTTIGAGAFNNTQGHLLTSVTIPNGVTSIGNQAFYACGGLTSVTIGNSVTSIGNSAFHDCDGLTSVTIPNSVTSIGNQAFYSCGRLTSVTIGNSVTSIGANAFYFCSSLTSVTIPNSVTSIGEYAFGNCSSLTILAVDPGNPSYSSSADGILFNKTATWLIQYPGGKQGAYVIPNSVTAIGIHAFWVCSKLTSVTIPNSVTSIGGSAFGNCSALTVAYFLGNAPTMYGSVFESCAPGFVVRYVSGTTGWTNPWYGYPASASSGTMYTLTTTASPPAGGSIGWSPVAASYASGTVLTLTATPAAGYTFTNWSGNVTGTANPQTIAMDGNKTVTATFTAVPTYTLTPSAGTGGTMTPNTAQTVLQGGSATFSIAANTGYHIVSVTIDGVSQGAISSYTFTNVTSNHTISARFGQEVKQTVIVLQVGKSTFTVNGVLKTLDSPPVIKNGRTLVPIRAIIEALGGTVGWDGTARKATVTLGSATVELWIGKSAAKVNGVSTLIDPANANVVPEIINGRTMLPVRFVSENLGCSVLWEDATKTITITYAS